jgi:hypothetical protein
MDSAIYIIIEKREVLPHQCGEKVSVQRVKTGNPVSDFERFFNVKYLNQHVLSMLLSLKWPHHSFEACTFEMFFAFDFLSKEYPIAVKMI